jgi:HAD superfamily hydrolase (TIGR01490 family)
MALALFDLDNTLLAGDSDYSWGQYLIQLGVVDGAEYAKANEKFYEDYKQGRLDIHAFAHFAYQPLTRFPLQQLEQWRQNYVQTIIRPMMLPKGQARIDWHRQRGDELVIITATNSFITRPIAEAFGVQHLIATEPLFADGRFHASIDGVPCFQQGKVTRLELWLEKHKQTLKESWFYSDSHNDIPLLETVSYPYAVDPDDELRRLAIKKGWEILSFRDTDSLQSSTGT